MAQASVEARYDDKHKDLPFHDGTFRNWAAERSQMTPFHYRDGVTLWVAGMDLNPADDFLGSGRANQAPDDDAESGEGND